MRYIYLGAGGTDPALVGAPCDPVRRTDGRCVVGKGNALVVFADGVRRVVVRRRLRLASDALMERLAAANPVSRVERLTGANLPERWR